MEPTLKINEVAAILRLNPMTIYRWVKSGKIQAMRVGKTALRISKGELYRIMESTPKFREQAAREARDFIDSNPAYLPTRANENRILDFIDRNDLPVTQESIAKAFEVLTYFGALESRPTPAATEELPNA